MPKDFRKSIFEQLFEQATPEQQRRMLGNEENNASAAAHNSAFAAAFAAAADAQTKFLISLISLLRKVMNQVIWK